MTTRLPKQRLRLEGNRALCGRCGAQVGSVSPPARVNLFPTFSLADEGVWRMSRRGRDQLRSGREPRNRRPVPFGPAGEWNKKPVTASTAVEARHPWTIVRELPTVIECPWCGAPNRHGD